MQKIVEMKDKRFPGESLEWEKRMASTLQFTDSMSCEVRFERNKKYKVAGIFY